MEIAEGIEIVGLGIYVQNEQALIVSDLQLGYEEIMNRMGVLVPRFNYSEIKKSFESIFEELEARGVKEIGTVIINGDFKHEFGKILEQEWAEIIDTIAYLQKKCRKLVLVKGNHDVALEPIAKWKDVEFVDYVLLENGKTLVVHGDSLSFKEQLKKAERIIIGHEHPAVTIREGVKAETFKCFLKGKWKDRILIVLPSMNSMAIGNDVTKNKLLSPFLKKGVEEFEVWAVEDKPYYFGKIKDLE